MPISAYTLKNSIIVTVSVVVIVLLATSAAGYVMGRYAFVGKKLIMGIFMASITIPLVFTVNSYLRIIKRNGIRVQSVRLNSGRSRRRTCNLPDAVFQFLRRSSQGTGRSGNY